MVDKFKPKKDIEDLTVPGCKDESRLAATHKLVEAGERMVAPPGGDQLDTPEKVGNPTARRRRKLRLEQDPQQWLVDQKARWATLKAPPRAQQNFSSNWHVLNATRTRNGTLELWVYGMGDCFKLDVQDWRQSIFVSTKPGDVGHNLEHSKEGKRVQKEMPRNLEAPRLVELRPLTDLRTPEDEHGLGSHAAWATNLQSVAGEFHGIFETEVPIEFDFALRVGCVLVKPAPKCVNEALGTNG